MTTARTEASGHPLVSSQAPTAKWWTSAFGLSIRGSFETDAFVFRAQPDGGATVELHLTSARVLEESWQPSEPVRLADVRWPDGTQCITVDEDRQLGYRIWGKDAGQYHLSVNGNVVTCAPGDLPDWTWQRFVIGQVLPFASALHGYELLHASAVRVGDRAVALVGGSLAGKTSLAVHLVLRGAEFIADDVVALERRGHRVWAYPGTPIAGIRHSEIERLGPDQQLRLGRPVGSNEKEVLYHVPSAETAVPLGGVYFIDRATAADALSFEAVTDPRLLMSSTFNFMHRPPQRLAELLDVCAALDATTQVCRVTAPTDLSASELAEAIENQFDSLSHVPSTPWSATA